MVTNRFKWLPKIRLDHFIAVFAVVGIFAIAVGRAPKDPLIAKVEKLESEYKKTFTRKKDLESALAQKDVFEELKLGLTSPEYLKFVEQMKTFKKTLETESVKRASLSGGDIRLNNVAVAANRYYGLQMKLYVNYLKNAHADPAGAKAYHPWAMDFLNVRVDSKASLPFQVNDEFKKLYSIRHVKDEKGGFSRVELFMNAEEKRMSEYLLLLDPKSKFEYMKLIQFATLRETLVNRWAIRRMSGLAFGGDDPTINACAPELVSYRMGKVAPISRTEQFEQLWAADNYGDLMNLRKGIVKLSRDRNLMSTAAYADLASRYIMGFKEFAEERLPYYLETQTTGDLEKLFTNFFGPSVGRLEEESWFPVAAEKPQKNTKTGKLEEAMTVADMAFMDYNLPSDDLSPSAMGERYAWIAWEMRKKFLADALVVFAQDQQLREAKKPEHHRRAIEMVNKSVAPIEKAWKDHLKDSIERHMTSYAGLYKADRNVLRFKEIQRAIIPAASQGARALLALDATKKAKKDLGKLTGEVNDPKSKYAYASGIWSRHSPKLAGTNNKRLFLYSPDHISNFFFEKLQYWVEHDEKMFNNSADPMEQCVAKQIMGNRAVMTHMNKFFAYLSEDFQAAAQKMDQEINAVNTPLLDDEMIIKAGKRAYVELSMAISNPPAVAPTVSPLPVPKPRAPAKVRPDTYQAVADATRVAQRLVPSIRSAANDSLYIADAKKRHATQLLFSEAMAMLSLNAVVTGVPPSIELPPNSRMPKDNLVHRIQSWAAIEWLLNRQDPNLRLRDRIASSIADQNILGKVLLTEAYSRAPILAIQQENVEDAPSMLKRALPHYTIGKGWDMPAFESEMYKALNTAHANDRGKLEDFCAANLRNPKGDEKFRKLFQSSSSLRELFVKANPKLAAWDDELKKETRTKWQRILQDIIDPLSMVIFAAIVIVVLWQIAPLIFGMASATGATAAAGTAAAASGGGIFASFGTFLGWIFTANYGPAGVMFLCQTIMMVNVYLYQLPPQLKYQLSSANSQIGLFTTPIASREKIKEFRDEVHSMQKWTYFAIAGEMVGQIVAARHAMKSLGILGKNKLKSLSAGLSDDLVREMRVEPLSELVEKHGWKKGMQIYGARYVKAAQTYKRVGALNEATANFDNLKTMFARNISTQLPETELLDMIYAKKIADLETKYRALKGRGDDVARFVENPKEFIFPQKVGIWFRNIRLKITPKGPLSSTGRTWSMLVAKDLDEVAMGKLHTDLNSLSEIRSAILLKRAQEIGFKLEQMKGFRKALAEAKSVTGAADSPMLRHLMKLDEDEIVEHVSLFKWMRRYPFDSRFYGIRAAMRDLNFLKEDLARLKPAVQAVARFHVNDEVDAYINERGEVSPITPEEARNLKEEDHELFTFDESEMPREEGRIDQTQSGDGAATGFDGDTPLAEPEPGAIDADAE